MIWRGKVKRKTKPDPITVSGPDKVPWSPRRGHFDVSKYKCLINIICLNAVLRRTVDNPDMPLSLVHWGSVLKKRIRERVTRAKMSGLPRMMWVGNLWARSLSPRVQNVWVRAPQVGNLVRHGTVSTRSRRTYSLTDVPIHIHFPLCLTHQYIRSIVTPATPHTLP